MILLFSLCSEVQEVKESPSPPKTSAAAQLDELMAHLCEMQAKVSKGPGVSTSGFISLEPSSTFPVLGTLLSCHLFSRTISNSMDELNFVLCSIWTQKIMRSTL